jgi:hypothetical protein
MYVEVANEPARSADHRPSATAGGVVVVVSSRTVGGGNEGKGPFDAITTAEPDLLLHGTVLIQPNACVSACNFLGAD